MNKKYTLIVVFINAIFAQVSMGDLRSLSNDQLDAIKKELQSAGATSVSESSIDVE